MDDLATQHTGKRIVLVAHGGWIRSALRVVSGHNPDIADVTIPNASCSYVSYSASGWHLGELGVADYAPLFD